MYSDSGPPRAESDQDGRSASAPLSGLAMSALPEPRQGGRPPLILVEDDDALRRGLQLLLQGQGFDVRAFALASSALDHGRASAPGYLVVDYRLAEDDGIALLRTMRAEGWSGVAVLITAYPTPEVRTSAAEVGFAAVLDKPFRDNDLLRALLR